MSIPGEDVWNGEGGQLWLTHIDRFEGMVAPVGEALIARADVTRAVATPPRFVTGLAKRACQLAKPLR